MTKFHFNSDIINHLVQPFSLPSHASTPNCVKGTETALKLFQCTTQKQTSTLELILAVSLVPTLPVSLTSSLSRMIWRLRSRSRTICLSLASITASLYLLLLLASNSISFQSCDTLLPPRAHVLRDLARQNVPPAGVKSTAGAARGGSSDRDASSKVKGRVDRARASAEPGLSKLEALFDHPLYSSQRPAIHEEDRLLKERPKVGASERSSQMWSVQKATPSQSLLGLPTTLL